ncbi:MAG: peptidylprolyl isomerase [Pseudomonadota bacterium]
MAPLFSAVVALLWIAVAAPAVAQDTADDPVVAKVDDQTIRLSDLQRDQQALPEQYRGVPLDVMFELLRTRAIDNALLTAEAERLDLATDPEVEATMAELRRAVVRNRLVALTVEDASNDERLRSLYDDLEDQPEFSHEEVRASHILVETEEEAGAVIAELDGGADFAALATERSIDPSAANNGGDLGFFAREQMVEPFADAAFAMADGETSAAPVESQFGWHVIRVAERRMVTPTFEESVEELRESASREAVTGLLERLNDEAEVERFDIEGNPVPAEPAEPAEPATE